MRTAYRCRAYPDPEQAAMLNRTFGCARLVWNKTLAEVSSVPLQQALRHQHTPGWSATMI